LFSNPACMRRDIQTHCLGYLLHGLGIFFALGKNC
jgi:hypothetical protein